MKTTLQIIVPRRMHCCCQGKEPLKPGMEYYSMLTGQIQDEQYERLDYCAPCWDIHKTNAKQGSYWKGTIPHQIPPSELPKQKDARALHLLKEALSSDDTESIAEAFILSLYLARRKRLLLRKEMNLHNELPGSLYEISDTEEMILVPKLKLSELEIEKLQLLLAKKFQSL